MAEAVFKHLVEENQMEQFFHIESAGTSTYHIGERPHIGTQLILKRKGVPLEETLRAQKLNRNQAGDFDYLIAMDRGHLNVLQGLGNAYRLLEFAASETVSDVPDPYYDDNFEQVYDLVLEGCKGLLDYIRKQSGI